MIPTEPIGSLPRPPALVDALGRIDSDDPSLEPLYLAATTDDCGFSPFCDDTSTTRDTAFAKIRASVEGTTLASRILLKTP